MNIENINKIFLNLETILNQIYQDNIIYLFIFIIILTNIKSFLFKKSPSIITYILNLPVIIFHDGLRHLVSKIFKIQKSTLGFTSFSSTYRSTGKIQYIKDKENPQNIAHFFIFISPLFYLIPLIYSGINEEYLISIFNNYLFNNNTIYSSLLYFLIIFVLMESFSPTFGELFDYVGFFTSLFIFIFFSSFLFLIFYIDNSFVNLLIDKLTNILKTFDVKIYLFIIIHYLLIIFTLFIFFLLKKKKKD